MFSLEEKRNTFVLLLTISGLVFFYLFSYYVSYIPIEISRLRFASHDVATESNTTKGVKYILYWTTMFSSTNFHFQKNGSELFEGCEYSNCFATDNRTLVPIDEYAAVLFYSPTSFHGRKKETIPARRKPHQRYIYANSETPSRFGDPTVTQYVFNNFYNWTMTYRFDSDVVRRHGYLVEGETKYKMPPRAYFANKTGSVAWVVSNCHNAISNREVLAKELAKHVKLDVYGKCGDKDCPKDCFDMIEKNYKFYLSFENSYCKDYTTEKLYKILQRNIIPIVYGGGNYTAVTPPTSVINVEDFNNIEELAYFINYLNDNLDDYLEYFEWKKHYKIAIESKRVACKLCEMLNDPKLPPKTYRNIHHWWFSKEMSQCKSGDELPPIAIKKR